MKNIFITSLIATLTSCNMGVYSEDINEKYLYLDCGDSCKQIVSNVAKVPDIYSNVVNYKFNDDFLVVLQKPCFRFQKMSLGAKLRFNNPLFRKNTSEDIAASEVIADSILKNDPITGRY